MKSSSILKVVGIVMMCAAIHYGLSQLPWLVVFGAGIGFIVLP